MGEQLGQMNIEITKTAFAINVEGNETIARAR
jgi:hypothetical protein